MELIQAADAKARHCTAGCGWSNCRRRGSGFVGVERCGRTPQTCRTPRCWRCFRRRVCGPEGQVSRQTAFAIIASMSGRSVETRGEYSALARSVSNAVGLARLRRHRARASPAELAAGKRLHGQTPYQTDRHRARRQRSPYQEAVSRTTFVRLGVGSDPSCPSDQPVGAPPGIRTQNLRIKRPGELALTRRQELHYVDKSAGSFLSDTHQCHWTSPVRRRH